MKKTLVSALTTALVVGAASTTFAAANPFSDVPQSHWAYEAVTDLAEKGVLEGMGDGTFQGSRSITRYEVAQAIARAMAKNTATGDDKAKLDKLAAEFHDELSNLGVRVDKLERNSDNVKWNGKAEYTYKSVRNRDAHTKENSDTLLFRLEPSAEVNNHWHVNARLDATANLQNDQGDNVHLERIWAQGDYDKLQVKFGKFASINDDSIADTAFSGAEVAYGKDVKVILGAGRLNTNDVWNDAGTVDGTSNYQYAGLELNKNKLSAGAYWHRLNANDITNGGHFRYTTGAPVPYANSKTDEFNVWMLKGAYKFSKNVALNGFYAQNHDADYFHKAGSVELDYKGAEQENKGSWGAWTAYRHLGCNAMISNPFDVIRLNQKGWEIGGNYTLFKNIVGTLRYGRGKQLNGDTKVENLFGRVEFFF